MDEKSLFTEFWSKEAKTTSKVLSRIPEGSDYRPDPKSRTAREIAWQIVNEEKMIIDALENGTAAWAPAPAPATMKELCETYDTQSAEIVRRLQELPAARWAGTLEFFGRSAAGVAHGVELSLRHRAPPWPDNDVSAPDGIHRAAGIRSERGRAVGPLTAIGRAPAPSAADGAHGRWRTHERAQAHDSPLTSSKFTTNHSLLAAAVLLIPRSKHESRDASTRPWKRSADNGTAGG